MNMSNTPSNNKHGEAVPLEPELKPLNEAEQDLNDLKEEVLEEQAEHEQAPRNGS